MHQPPSHSLLFSFLSSIAILGIATEYAAGTGLEQAYQSAKGSALGNAVIATIDDVSAIHHNPAGLAKLTDFEFQSQTLVLTGRTRYRGDLGSFKNEPITPIVGSLFLGGRIADGLGIGLGITAPHGLKAEYDRNIPNSSLGYDGSLEHIRYALGFGWQATPTLAIGGSIYYAHDDLENSLGFFPGDQWRYSGTGDGWGWSAGLQWQPREGHHFALTYRSGMTIETSGSTTYTGSTFSPFPSATSEASTAFPYPDQFLIGYAIEVNRWLFEVNVQHTEWDRVRTITRNEASPVFPLLPVSSVQNWNNSQFYSFGATYQWKKDIELRFGYLHGTQSVPDRASSPLLTDSPYHAVSVGIGVERGDWEFDASVIANWRETQNISTSPVNAGISNNGQYKTRSVAFHFGVTRHF